MTLAERLRRWRARMLLQVSRWNIPDPVPVVPPSDPAGSDLPMGAGGWITRIDIAPDGVQACRADTYDGFVRDSAAGTWRRLVTTNSMPSGHHGHDGSGDLIFNYGVYEIAIAPTNSNVLYMLYNDRAYKSTDRGVTWSYLSNYSTTTFAANDSFRMNGPRMAVSPSNSDHVIAVTPSTVRKTTDGGASWSTVSGVTAPTSSAGGMVAFDPNDANNVYIATDGNGVYRSTTGISGAFTLTSSGPTSFQGLDHDNHSRLWACARSGDPNLYKFASGSWSTVDFGGQSSRAHCVISDSSDANTIYVQIDSGDIAHTTDGGSNWTDMGFGCTRSAGVGQPGWMANTLETYMSCGNSKFYSNKIYFAQGIGVWNATPPTGANTAWNADSIGIEQLVVNEVFTNQSGVIFVANWDRPIFKLDGTNYPANHGPDYSHSIRACWAADYASSDGTCIAGFMTGGESKVFFSTSSGDSWTEKTIPSNLDSNGGSFAASTPTNWCAVGQATGSRMLYTTDQGDTWNFSTMTGVPTSGNTGWGNNSSLNRHILCADRVTSNKFYAYNNGANADVSYAGIWVTTNSGATWTRVFSGRLVTDVDPGVLEGYNGFNARLRSVPGKAGHLFFTGGDVGGSVAGDLLYSTDAGVTWTAVPNVKEAKAIGCGKEAPSGGGYPAIYMVGWLNGVYGIYRCDNGHLSLGSWTWTSLGTFPLGRADIIADVNGNLATYGRWYIGYRGSGAIQGG